MDVAASGGSGGEGEAGGPLTGGTDSIGDGAGASSGGGAAAVSPSMAPVTNSGGPTRERCAASIVSVEVPNTDVDLMVDAPSSSSGRTKKKARKK